MTASDNDEISENPDKKYRGNVPVVDSVDQMSPVERKLTKLFKCSFYRNRCFFTSDDPASFMRHLETRHRGENAYCIYCYYYSGENKSYERTDGLIDHILTHHGFRNFQCNSCVYRGTSIPHVLLHQANIHGNKYQTTLSGEGSIGLCKVLVCKQIVNGPLPSETVHWSNCRVDRVIASPNESPKYQCLYCDFVSLVPHVVFFHICKVHPDYSLCLFDKYVDPLPEIEEADEKNAEEALKNEDLELDAIVNELHSIGTKDDDDVDMTPVDEHVSEIFSDDENENQNRQPTESSRERLFAVKGLRIAKKQSDSSKARKSTSSSRHQSEPDFDKDDEDDDGDGEGEYLNIRKRRGFRPEQSAALFTPVPLTGSKHSARNMFKCTICADNTQLSKVAIEAHLLLKHNTTSSFKCSECDFLGSSTAINIHFRTIHSSIETTVRAIKFIVALDEKEEASKTMTGQSLRPGSISEPKSSKKSSEKDPKNLSSRIKRSVFIGPKSWKEKQKQKRKERGEIEEDSGSDAETICGDAYPEEMVVDEQEEGQVQDNRANRRIHRAKRKTKDYETIMAPSQPVEELLEPKSSIERGSTFFFCLFCNTFSSTDFDEAQTHMKRHLGLDKITCPKCFTFECSNMRDLKLHCENDHPFDSVEIDDNNKHINYITEFLNEQFIRRFKSDQMSSEQATRYARIICPICERANQLTGNANYHHISWKSFKRHFWKHANATYIHCKICKALVPRIIKRNHLDQDHGDEISEDIFKLKDLKKYYDDPLSVRALNCLKSYKLKCKAFYEGRIKEEFEIEECRVVLGTELKRAMSATVKQEPLDTW